MLLESTTSITSSLNRVQLAVAAVLNVAAKLQVQKHKSDRFGDFMSKVQTSPSQKSSNGPSCVPAGPPVGAVSLQLTTYIIYMKQLCFTSASSLLAQSTAFTDSQGRRCIPRSWRKMLGSYRIRESTSVARLFPAAQVQLPFICNGGGKTDLRRSPQHPGTLRPTLTNNL